MKAKERALGEEREMVLPFRKPTPTRIGYNSFVFLHASGYLELASERYATDDFQWVEGPVFMDPINPHECFTIRLIDMETGVTYPLASPREALAARQRGSRPG